MKSFAFSVVWTLFIYLGVSLADAWNHESYGNLLKVAEKSVPTLDESFVRPVLINFLDNKKNCLTGEEEKRFNAIIKNIDDILVFVSDGIKTSADFIDDDTFEASLYKIAGTVDKVRTEIVDKTEQIANEMCGSCQEISKAIEDGIEVILNALVDIDPKLKDEKWFEAIVTTARGSAKVAEDICNAISLESFTFLDNPNFFSIDDVSASNLRNQVSEHTCLSQEQKQDVAEIIQLAGNVLNTFAEWLKQSESKAKSNELKKIIARIADILISERKALEKNGEQYVEELCKGCAKVSHFAGLIFNRIEKLLNIFVPFWKEIPKVGGLVEEVDKFLKEIENVCPYEYREQKLYKYRLDQKAISQNEVAERLNNFNEIRLFIDTVKENVLGFVLKNVPSGSRQDILHSFQQIGWETDIDAGFGCADIVSMVDDALTSLESLLDQFVPMWRKLPFMDKFDELLHDVLRKVEDLCKGSGSDLLQYHSNYFKLCATEAASPKLLAQRTKLLKAIAEFDKSVKEPKMQPVLKTLESFADSLIETEGSTLCKLCAFAADSGSSLLEGIEIALDKFVPFWKRIPFAQKLLEVVEEALEKIKSICSPEESFLLKSKLCMTDSDRLIAQWHLAAAQIFAESEVYLQKDDYSGVYRGRVAKAIEYDLVSNEPCLSCESIVVEAEKIITEVEETLNRVFPAWNSLPLIPQIQNFVHMILDKLLEMCPKEALHLYTHALVKKSFSCLSEEEENHFNEALETINNFFDEVEDQIDEIIEKVPIEQVKDILQNVKEQIASVEEDVDEQAKEGIKQLCLACGQVGKSLEKSLDQLESGLSELIPNWRDNSLMDQLATQIESAINKWEEKCPADGLIIARDGCLDVEEKEKIYNISKAVKVSLDVVANVVELRADFEPNPLKKISLKKAAQVIRVIGNDVVLNISTLADQYCGTCDDLISAIKNTFFVLEKALFDVDPLWKKTPLYDGIKDITDDVFNQVDKLCTKNLQFQPRLKEECSTPEQKHKIEGYVNQVDGVLTYAADTLETFANQIDNAELSEEFTEIAEELKAFDKDLVKNFTHIAAESCGTCLDIVRAMKDFENAVESFMSDIDSNWRDDPNFSSIAFGVDTLIGLIESLCPSEKFSCELSLEEVTLLHAAADFNRVTVKLQRKLTGSTQLQKEIISAGNEIRIAKCPNRESSLLFLKNAELLGVESEFKFCHSATAWFSFFDVAIGKLFEVVEAAESMEKNTKHRAAIGVAKGLVKGLEKDLKENLLLKQENNVCLSCDDIIDAINDAVRTMKKFITDLVPSLETNPVLDAIMTAIDSLLTTARELCPGDEI